MRLPIAQIVRCTQAEGPGLRLAIWVQGCPLNCPGCCNPEMIPFTGGTLTTVDELISEVQTARADHGIQGVTIMGGEPFAHAASLQHFVEEVQGLKLSVMIFSGYTIEELRAQHSAEVDGVLSSTDILVDGRYEATRPDTSRRWIGSTNQRIHFLTDRYHEADACWQQPDTLEVRWHNGELTVNGFPAKSLADLWTGRHLGARRPV